MRRTFRLVLLALALAVALPAARPPDAHAATDVATTDSKLVKALSDWLKKNGPTLYIILDEFIDDVFGGCNCPPPTQDPPPAEEPPTQP